MKLVDWDILIDILITYPVWFIGLIIVIYYTHKNIFMFIGQYFNIFQQKIFFKKLYWQKFAFNNASDANNQLVSRKFQVENMRMVANDILNITLTPINQMKLHPFVAGQYITLKFVDPLLKRHLRCYSLTNYDPNPKKYEIAVKWDKASQNDFSVSREIHTKLKIGSMVSLMDPQGDFILKPEHQGREIIFLSSGIGITPFYSMLQSVSPEHARKISVYHIARNAQSVPFGSDIFILSMQKGFNYIPYFTERINSETGESERQKPEIYKLLNLAKRKKDFIIYFCGSDAVMETLLPPLVEWGLPQENFVFEAFNPDSLRKIHKLFSKTKEVTENAKQFKVEFTRSKKSVIVSEKDEETILEIAKKNNVFIDSGCKTGNCGSCLVKLRGDNSYFVKPTFQAPEGFVLSCISNPKSHCEVEA